MGVWLNSDAKDYFVFVIAFSSEAVEFKERKLNFMRGIANAIHAAAFNSEEEAQAESNDENLDEREIFNPRTLTATPRCSQSDFQALDPPVDRVRANSNPPEVSAGLDSWAVRTGLESGADSEVETSAHTQYSVASSGASSGEFVPLFNAAVTVPTWEPSAPFNFPVAQMPCLYPQLHFSCLSVFEDLKHIANGSNSNVYLGSFQNQKVIVKMIMQDVVNDQVTQHEFDIEYGMLARIDHKNIIKVLGSGSVPRRFIVIEYLSGGSLFQLLNKYQTKPSLAQRLFRKPTFTYSQLLDRAKEMVNALLYMHQNCNGGATIIHRDLKPDNVGFAADGTLKLFDFGLVTCVRKTTSKHETYNMTGNTGSLRYMAPEVALKLPYTEKVDVYSFSIMLWQMARDRVPFNGWSKAEFMKGVVYNKQRPKLDKTWPLAFSSLLSNCWDHNPEVRPSFSEILVQIDGLIFDLENADSKKVHSGILKSTSGRWGVGPKKVVQAVVKDDGNASEAKSAKTEKEVGKEEERESGLAVKPVLHSANSSWF